ncbi:MAG: hypothetical protein ACLRS2_19380 [[Clostridium] innocuum]
MIVACYAFLINRLIAGMAIDEFVFYLGIISGFSLWFKKVEESYARMSVNNVLINRMRTALHMKNRMHHGSGVKLDQKEITITFDHVSFLIRIRIGTYWMMFPLPCMPDKSLHWSAQTEPGKVRL